MPVVPAMPAMIEIRPAARPDLESLVALVRSELECKEQFSQTFKLASDIDWSEYVAAKLRPGSSQLLVAQSAQGLVGYIEFRVAGQSGGRSGNRLKRLLKLILNRGSLPPVVPVQPRQYGYIEDVFVLPDLRSQGVASRLIQSALAWFAERDIHQVEAAVWSPNRASLGLFEKLGFRQVRILVGRSV